MIRDHPMRIPYTGDLQPVETDGTDLSDVQTVRMVRPADGLSAPADFEPMGLCGRKFDHHLWITDSVRIDAPGDRPSIDTH